MMWTTFLLLLVVTLCDVVTSQHNIECNMRNNYDSSTIDFTANGNKCKNTMGYVYNTDIIDTMHLMNSSTVQTIIDLVSLHGVIVIPLKNDLQFSQSNDLLQFAMQFGEIIHLPGGFGGENDDNDVTNITIITNIDSVTDEVIIDHHFAEYLHNDGDFWIENDIFTFLYGRTVPTIGGQTEFIDLRLAHDYLMNNFSDIYAQIADKTVAIDVNSIPDFQSSNFLQEFNDKYGIAHHAMIDRHRRRTNDSLVYYAHKNAQFADKDGNEICSKNSCNRILHTINDILLSDDFRYGRYEHSWTENDLLIWDNIAVMHRSLAGYSNNRRLLWRAQSWISWYAL